VFSTTYSHPRSSPESNEGALRFRLRGRAIRTRSAKALCCGALASSLLVAGFGLAVPSAAAASTTTVDLGSASTYAVFSGASVGNTVNAVGAPHTTLRGDLGVAVDAQPTGFPPGVVTGTTQVGTTAAVQAQADLKAAYNGVVARTGGTTIAGALAGTTVTPGLYSIAGAASNTGTLILDGNGNPNAVFVFQVGGALTMAAGAQITLVNGAQASNVFWQVDGAGGIGANASFVGTLMAHDAIAVGADTVFNGRALALTGAVSLNANEFYSAPPTVTIAGGATAFTNDPTPNITGTTDLDAPGVVTVTIAGQTLTGTPSNGAWSVNSAILANGTYTVLASVTDGAGNTSSATQQLTIDTVLPVITINGGPSVSTNDPTRTIAGTTDAAPGAIVRVNVAGQALTALVQPSGTWNIAPTALGDGTYTITASVTDRAGNVGTTSQALTVDTVPPAVTITGGATRLTNGPTPAISGTAAVAPGTVVTVTLADQTLTGLVQSNGTWSVTAGFLADGPHRIIMTVTDAYGNVASATQTLTIATGPTGGRSRLTLRLSAAIYKDARGRRVQVRFVLNGPARVTLTVLRGKRVVATLSTTRREAGHGLLTWSGKIRKAPASKGSYKIMMRAVSPAGALARAAAALRIT
jgi:hypothetical protein